ncbi:MAG: Gfo/Idh/MocA family oxidoreductase [Opitutaceae bacterium]|nr:Gfo/Idh/MocA family oxidoreductase [Opitutaceae bacterium]
MRKSSPLRLAALGGGNRSQVYFLHAAKFPSSYSLVAAADRHAARRARMREISGLPGFREFSTAEELLAAPRLAEVLIVGTQDASHFAHAGAALRAGYDLLLEKPIATSPEDVLALRDLAGSLGRRVLVCHVLRYTSLFRRVHALLSDGAIGELVSLEATQGLDPWHQAHSYVRGHWGVAEHSTPLTVANSCHDLDIISWLVDAPCSRVSSFGGLHFFNSRHSPPGAPRRCTDGCPAAETCPYDAHRYLSDKRNWLNAVFDRANSATNVEIIDWLRTSKWGRCVFQCDNTTVDHQTVALEFVNGVTSSFTVTAFSHGRDLALFGTKGRLLAGARVRETAGCDILLETFGNRDRECIQVPAGPDMDETLMRELADELARPDPADMLSSLDRSVDSHLMGFAAETSRRTGKTVRLTPVGISA